MKKKKIKIPKGYISKTAVFQLNTILDSVIESGGSFEGFLDLLVESIDMPLLMDIRYEVIGTTKNGEIKIRITGDPSECYEEEE